MIEQIMLGVGVGATLALIAIMVGVLGKIVLGMAKVNKDLTLQLKIISSEMAAKQLAEGGDGLCARTVLGHSIKTTEHITHPEAKPITREATRSKRNPSLTIQSGGNRR